MVSRSTQEFDRGVFGGDTGRRGLTSQEVVSAAGVCEVCVCALVYSTTHAGCQPVLCSVSRWLPVAADVSIF